MSMTMTMPMQCMTHCRADNAGRVIKLRVRLAQAYIRMYIGICIHPAAKNTALLEESPLPRTLPVLYGECVNGGGRRQDTPM